MCIIVILHFFFIGKLHMQQLVSNPQSHLRLALARGVPFELKLIGCNPILIILKNFFQEHYMNEI